jgi:tRNA nucleotidyltransferase (CCA-adding enzyme)
VVWTTPDTNIFDEAQLMLTHNIGGLPLLENENLVGMVTRTDLIKTIVV